MRCKIIPAFTESDKSRFWSYVQKAGMDECWPWLAFVDEHKYGKFTIFRNGKQDIFLCNRVALFLATGEQDIHKVCMHTCDNPSCCNPRHLRWGTQQENISDMQQKGRERHPTPTNGTINGMSKLDDNKVLEIRSKWKNRFSTNILAKEYNVSPQCIRDIIRRITWKHI